jgi:hypothetical protein
LCDAQHNGIQQYDTQHNDTQHNDSQHNDTEHNRIAAQLKQHLTTSVVMLSVYLVTAESCYSECCYGEGRVAFAPKLAEKYSNLGSRGDSSGFLPLFM